MQIGDVAVEPVEAAAVALHAIAETGHHRAQICQRAAPRRHGVALRRHGHVQRQKRPAQPLLAVLRSGVRPAASGNGMILALTAVCSDIDSALTGGND